MITNIPEYKDQYITQLGNFYVVSQNMEYDGGLRVTTKGKKVTE